MNPRANPSRAKSIRAKKGLGLASVEAIANAAIKYLGYLFWRTVFVRAPQWRAVMDAWYYEIPPAPVIFNGNSDPRNQDIANNAGFKKLLDCWIAQNNGASVLSGRWVVKADEFTWEFAYNPSNAAGKLAAYTDATYFLGSYTAKVQDAGKSSAHYHKYKISVTNTSGWTSATRLLGFVSKFGIHAVSVFVDHARGAGTENPSRGGNLHEVYNFEVNACPDAKCQLP